jgi:NAD-dependent deacetylase
MAAHLSAERSFCNDDRTQLRAGFGGRLAALMAISTAARQIADALDAEPGPLLVLTGAGISLASGIPTFRGTDAGAVWATTAMARATWEHFVADPVDSWTWYRQRLDGVLAAAPNPAHHALAAIEAWAADRGRAFTLITQNIDPLHERAGSRALIKVHGSIDRARCTNPRCPDGGALVPVEQLDFAALDTDPQPDAVPRCATCHHLMRPHVLWFDEHYGSHASFRWDDVLAACDTMRLALAIGTSFSVGVTELLAAESRRRAVPLFVIDPQAVAVGGRRVVTLREKAETLLPEVCALVGAPP